MVLFDANFSIQRAKQRFRHLLQSSCLREGSKGTGGGESPVFWQVVVLYNCWFEIDAALLLHWQPKKEEKHRHVGENNYSWVTDTDGVQRGAINRWDPRLGSSIKRLMSCSQRKYSFGLTAQRVKKKQREETTPEVSPESQWEAWRVRLSFKHPTVLLISVTKKQPRSTSVWKQPQVWGRYFQREAMLHTGVGFVMLWSNIKEHQKELFKTRADARNCPSK